MRYEDALMTLIEDNNGFIVTSDLNERRIPREYLRRFIQAGQLEKIDRGAYITPDAYDDEMYRYQVRFKPIIYSHTSALFFHQLTDELPEKYTVTVYSGYQTTNLKCLGVNTFFIKKDLFEVGLMEGKTLYGRQVRIYNEERTICDCLRSRNKMNELLTIGSIKKYIQKKAGNLSKLLEYADIFGVTSILKWYIEVGLSDMGMNKLIGVNLNEK